MGISRANWPGYCIAIGSAPSIEVDDEPVSYDHILSYTTMGVDVVSSSEFTDSSPSVVANTTYRWIWTIPSNHQLPPMRKMVREQIRIASYNPTHQCVPLATPPSRCYPSPACLPSAAHSGLMVVVKFIASTWTAIIPGPIRVFPPSRTLPTTHWCPTSADCLTLSAGCNIWNHCRSTTSK